MSVCVQLRVKDFNKSGPTQEVLFDQLTVQASSRTGGILLTHEDMNEREDDERGQFMLSEREDDAPGIIAWSWDVGGFQHIKSFSYSKTF